MKKSYYKLYKKVARRGYRASGIEGAKKEIFAKAKRINRRLNPRGIGSLFNQLGFEK